MLEKFKTNWPVVFLLVISGILCLVNYIPGTFLSGWDTLHPEFNFGLNLQRTIFGVFRVEQGLGAVAGHSHMADLPRIILLYISGFILPLSFLRYFYIFLNIIFGTLGMYFILNKYFLKHKTASFLGSLFYLLNIGTIQTFNVPFEMFTTLFATLPFMFYFATGYILDKNNRTKNLLAFAVIALLNSPSAYASTLWYMLFLSFFIYFFTLSFLRRAVDKKSLRHFFVLILVFIVINLFWIMPSLYFILNHSTEVQAANINRLFSEQAFLKNKEFGNIKDMLLLKSFYFDWSIYGGNGKFEDLLLPWINHFKDIKVLLTGYAFGLSIILGGILAFRKLKKQFLPPLLVFGFCLFFLINDNFPISFIYTFFQEHVPLFKEALRFPDNKIFNVYIFIISIFFGFFVSFAIEYLQKIRFKIKNVGYIFAILVVILLFFYSLPAFSGNFINKYMKVEIPKEYFNLFSYLNTQPESIRVANLPVQSPWGWAYYNWYKDKPSYQGAGFLYFGIKQPLLDRDFDRWSPHNESYYREMSYALYSGDKKLLSNVINKYKIGIIFIDKNVTDPQNQQSILLFDESKRLIRSTGLVKDERVFGEIEVFRLNVASEKLYAVNSNTNVFPKTTTTYEDFAFSTYNNYITYTKDNNFSKTYYPFRDLIDNQSKLHNDILKIDADKITLIPSISINNLAIDTLTKNMNLIPTDIVVQKQAGTINLSLYPNTPVFDNTPSSSPIKTVVNTAGRNNISVSINRNEFFNLSQIPDNIPFAAGKALLNNADNSISFFDTSSLTEVRGGFLSVNPFFSSCNNQNSPVTGFTQDGVKITGKGDICITIPYTFLSSYIKGNSKSVLTNIKFTFNSNAEVSSCLLDLKSLDCLYYSNPKVPDKDISLSSVLSSDQIANTAVKIFIKPRNKDQNTYSLNNASFSYAESFSDFLLTKTDIDRLFLGNSNFSFKKISLSKNVIYDPGFDITKIKNFQSDCLSSNSKTRKEIVTNEGLESIKYTSTVGSYCDHFSYPNLPHNQGYLVSINSKNQAGLPMTICISNYKTQKCDIYSDLSPFKSFKKDTFLLPPMHDSGVGYNINFENIGINKSPAENLISSIEIIPIPYDFLLNVKSEQKTQNSFNGNVTSYKTISPLSFIATTDGENTILTLYYSYENGFKAYSINCGNAFTCRIKSILAPFYAKELKDHVLVDNWANGWVTNGSKQVAIIFLPQYFETLGFILITLTLIALLYHLKQEKN